MVVFRPVDEPVVPDVEAVVEFDRRPTSRFIAAACKADALDCVDDEGAPPPRVRSANETREVQQQQQHAQVIESVYQR